MSRGQELAECVHILSRSYAGLFDSRELSSFPAGTKLFANVAGCCLAARLPPVASKEPCTTAQHVRTSDRTVQYSVILYVCVRCPVGKLPPKVSDLFPPAVHMFLRPAGRPSLSVQKSGRTRTGAPTPQSPATYINSRDFLEKCTTVSDSKFLSLF